MVSSAIAYDLGQWYLGLQQQNMFCSEIDNIKIIVYAEE